jgi:uncharacterized protein YciI
MNSKVAAARKDPTAVFPTHKDGVNWFEDKGVQERSGPANDVTKVESTPEALTSYKDC